MERFLLISLAGLAHLSTARGEAVDYLREIKPLLKERCYACHGALKQKADLRLDTGEAVRRGAKNEPVVSPQDIEKSSLLLRVTATDRDERMPPEGEPLTAVQIARLRSWIAQGAPSPAGELPEPDPREHWAFRPVSRPALPEISNQQAAIRNPIDAFVFHELEKRALTPGPVARKDILLRRIYLDLIGVPPTREELAAFLADAAPDAYEKVVDHLLATPPYAQRWARHWMDVWRYADWYGRRHVPDVWNSAPQVWRWRDWIVDSLAADKGYDRMLTEMLAADEVAPEDDNARVATGYLVRNWYALNPNQWMRDIVEHTGKAFLGLTFNCAHCHDHKYDPITQRDYFAFRAFFEPIQVRQDWAAGEPDPGSFQKYEYSTVRKVAPHGMVSVFDERLDAKTALYLRGDERSIPDDKPTVESTMPAFLGGDGLKKIERLELPPLAHTPGLKPFVQEGEKAKREQALAAAKTAREAAEKAVNAAREKLAGITAEQAGEREKADAAMKKSDEQLAAAQKALAAAQTAIDAPPAPTAIYPTQSTGRRRALAAWITSRDNPLTARVAVNHLWTRHFHAPLVSSVFDFGRNGAAPTHPELLDWLAVELMEHGWSMKHVHRLIVTSSAYRRASSVQSSVFGVQSPPEDADTENWKLNTEHWRSSAAIDPENRYLSRMNVGQMEAEVVRDSILHLAGELDLASGGKSIPNAEAEKSLRRSLYFECFPEPGGQSQFGELFDAPSSMECYRRTSTIVPQQALALSNSPLTFERSRALAARLPAELDNAAFVTAAFEQVLTRAPSGEESAACREFLGRPSAAPRASLIHALLNHHDFVTIR